MSAEVWYYCPPRKKQAILEYHNALLTTQPQKFGALQTHKNSLMQNLFSATV